MKGKLFKVLHFFKLDALLLRVLERLSASLTKKCQAIQTAMGRFVCCRIPATAEESPPRIA